MQIKKKLKERENQIKNKTILEKNKNKNKINLPTLNDNTDYDVKKSSHRERNML